MNAEQVAALLVVLVVAGVIYFVSLALHPSWDCSLCKGSGIHRGALFKKSKRLCRKCGGTGAQERWGRRFFWPKKL